MESSENFHQINTNLIKMYLVAAEIQHSETRRQPHFQEEFKISRINISRNTGRI